MNNLYSVPAIKSPDRLKHNRDELERSYMVKHLRERLDNLPQPKNGTKVWLLDHNFLTPCIIVILPSYTSYDGLTLSQVAMTFDENGLELKAMPQATVERFRRARAEAIAEIDRQKELENG